MGLIWLTIKFMETLHTIRTPLFDKKKISSNSSSSPKLFVAVAGNIGTGKTTLTKMLAERFNWQSHFEAVENNPYLADFYKNMERWSFPIQIFFLNSRYKAHQHIMGTQNSSIQDRTIYEDAHIFARNLYESKLLEERDYRTYLDLYEEMCKNLMAPDILIYLKKSLPRLKENISKRNRNYESKIPDEYLANLNGYYDDFALNYKYGKVLTIDTDDYDFVERETDFIEISKKILSSLDQTEMFL